jgi:F5/8 type C domain/Carboxylesterase family
MPTVKQTPTHSLAITAMIVAVAFFSSHAYMSTFPAGRFVNKVFNNVTTTNGVQFGSNTNPLNNNAAITLYCDVYQPTGDTCTSRPCIVCIYGGGFTGGGRSGEAGDATTYAQYGYVAVCPDYRMWGSPGGDGSDAQHKIWPAGFVVTAQDARACIRYLRAHASTYKIDTSLIAIAGCSSGAFITLNTAFMDEPSKIPSVVDTNIYGGIEGKSGTPGVNSRVCAAAGNSGAMLDTSWIETTSPPYFGFQSTPDAWGVPTDTGTPTAHWGPYFTYYGITPISVRLTHVGLLEGTVAASPNQHCPGGFADESHMFFYNAFCEVGRKSANNTNLALNKTATQSSTSANLAASRAVDGNTNGASSGNSYSLTNSQGQAWWQVDLGSQLIIDSIWAYNRTDSLVNHQTNYDVLFGTDGTNWETCAYERGIMATPSRYNFRGGIIGRYVRIQLRGTNSLSLAEVNVWARDTNHIVTGAFRSVNPSLSGRGGAATSASFLVKTDAGAFSLPAALKGPSAASVAIYDLSGRLVEKAVVKGVRVQMDRSHNVKTGLYLVRISPAL